MPGSAEPEDEYRAISPAELALFAVMHRKGLGWTQETLAEISRLTVRTIQRIENGQPSSIDTRRALARAFKTDDIDVFNKPHTFSSVEKIKREVQDIEKNYVTLDAVVARSGKQLADLVEEVNMLCFQQADNISEEAAKNIASLFDYLRDYGDVADEYSFTEKLGVHKTVSELLADIAKVGLSVCYARRSTEVVGRNWVDKAPLRLTIGYLLTAKIGQEPTQVVVAKAVHVGL